MPVHYSAKFEILMEADEQEDYEERQAIMEFDGGLSKDVSHIEALICILRKRVQKILAEERN